MGFSPLEGLVMTTRPGDIDPGTILHLQTVIRLSENGVDTMLNRESGLPSLSSYTSDMRDLLDSVYPVSQIAIALYKVLRCGVRLTQC